MLHNVKEVTWLFRCLDRTLTIQKSSVDFDSDRNVDVYFPPVSLDVQSAACLQMNFTAFTYFAVKLAYATVNNTYKERLLFRNMESLGKEFRLWETTVTPDMTEGEEFVVVLHAQSSSLGTMAVINSINLQMTSCNETGNHRLFSIYR